MSHTITSKPMIVLNKSETCNVELSTYYNQSNSSRNSTDETWTDVPLDADTEATIVSNKLSDHSASNSIQIIQHTSEGVLGDNIDATAGTPMRPVQEDNAVASHTLPSLLVIISCCAVLIL
eukprot:52482_1